MSSGGVLVTPIQENKSLLHSIFKFKPTSKLHEYICKKSNNEKKIFSLAEVLTVLKNVIRGEGQFDEKNPSIIMCSPDLEEALNMKALHVTEIRDLVLSHLIKIQDDAFIAKYCATISQQNISTPPPPVTPTTRLVHTANISTQVITDKKAKFTVKPDFLEVLRTLPDVDPKKTVFTYEEVTLYLSKYILSNKTKFFDNRNIKLAMVENDPLGIAFNVKAFHRCQVNNLLRAQLIPHDPDYVDTSVLVTRNTPGSGISVVEKPVPIVSSRGVAPAPDNLMGSAAGIVIPAFPALAKAQTLPANYNNPSLIRKREDSECDQDDLKRARLNNGSGSYSDDTETGNDTAAANDEDESDYDDDVNEYEPETEEEEERPPQANGRSTDKSSSSDSDSDVGESFKLIKKIVKEQGDLHKVESVYWGDEEEDKQMVKETGEVVKAESVYWEEDTKEKKMKELDSYDEELTSDDMWKCVTCKKPNKPFTRYCMSCWSIRRGWMGLDTRRKRRKVSKQVTRDSDTETDGAAESTERPRMESQDSGVGESQEMEVSAGSKPVLNRSISLDPATPSPASSLVSADSGYMSSSSSTSQLCLLCCHRPKNASLVHGRIGHQVCCYQCAKKLWKKRSDCPVCRRTVERIIKIIPA